MIRMLPAAGLALNVGPNRQGRAVETMAEYRVGDGQAQMGRDEDRGEQEAT